MKNHGRLRTQCLIFFAAHPDECLRSNDPELAVEESAQGKGDATPSGDRNRGPKKARKSPRGSPQSGIAHNVEKEGKDREEKAPLVVLKKKLPRMVGDN